MTTADVQSADARAHASETVRKSGTSFGPGMAILPPPRRAAMHAIYAFCREVDDIADDDGMAREERLRRLGAWRAEIDRVYGGRPQTPTGLALVEPCSAFDLPKDEFIMMIEGMEMDANGPVVAPSMETLRAYTRRVAGSVGLLSMPAFGAPKGEASDRFALSLADALQLTNILRDIEEDAKIGRLYLPAELLEKYDVPAEPARAPGAAGLPALKEELAGLARAEFAKTRAALDELHWPVLRPALLMMGVYETLLDRMARAGWATPGAASRLSRAEKLLVALRWFVAPRLQRAGA